MNACKCISAKILQTPEMYLGVSKKKLGTLKSSILLGFSIINHPFWGTPIFGNTHLGKILETLRATVLLGRS